MKFAVGNFLQHIVVCRHFLALVAFLRLHHLSEFTPNRALLITNNLEFDCFYQQRHTLKFKFPYYGHILSQVYITTGGEYLNLNHLVEVIY